MEDGRCRIRQAAGERQPGIHVLAENEPKERRREERRPHRRAEQQQVPQRHHQRPRRQVGLEARAPQHEGRVEQLDGIECSGEPRGGPDDGQDAPHASLDQRPVALHRVEQA